MADRRVRIRTADITLSLSASIVANFACLWYDSPWFESLTQIVVLAVGLAATIRLFTVFPFDLSGNEFDWEAVTRGILIMVMVAGAIGLIAEATKLVRAVAIE